MARLRDEFIVYDDGFRGRAFRYDEITALATAFAARLRAHGIRHGEAVVIWSESRPGWIVALWGCLLQGVVVVPVDPQFSVELFGRIKQKVRPRAVLLGDRVPVVTWPENLPVWRVSELEQKTAAAAFQPEPLFSDDVAEIIFTSGTTAEPKGVVITHGNLAAQVRPIDRGIAKYRKYVPYFAPLRILNLLPLSHLFGQALTTFIPPLIPASVVFLSSTSPQEIARQIHARRMYVLVAVPKALEVLREFVVHRYPEAADTSRGDQKWWLRWWQFRAVHRLFGWRFCCLLTGGAPLPADLEQFWTHLGFVVVQGYGLTETAPVISFSNPFNVRQGTTGKPISGVEVKIAEDGEVLVRGENVTPGYFEAPEETSGMFRDGWLRTGDYGELDAAGNLIIRGRKKDMIVTPEGLNVFPDDVEAVLNRLPGVRESAVVGQSQVHAVLALEPGANADEIVRQANAELEDHQKIRSVSVWSEGELPRTKTTRKLRRGEIANAVAHGNQPAAQTGAELAGLVARYAPGRTIGPDTTIEELGLSSLDRVELMMDLEAQLDTSIDEGAFAGVTKVADLARPMAASEPTVFPTYNRSWIARLIRGIALEVVLLPLTRGIARLKVSGLENLSGERGPVVFAANHQSHMDTPAILASLPRRWRRSIAPAMSKEYFDAHFHPERHSLGERWQNRVLYGLATLLFNAFPLPQTETGAREAMRYMGELADEGWSILIFPEGRRHVTGEIGRFLPGVGMIASRLHLPVIPVQLRGVDRVLPPATNRPDPGVVEVKFGAPLQLEGEAYAALAQRVEAAVRELQP